MGFRKRWTRLLSGTALVVAALSAAACASAPAFPAPAQAQAHAGSQASASTPALTRADAQQAFDAYISGMTRANTTGDSTLALSLVTGVQRAAVASTLKLADYAHRVPVFDRYVYGTPALYLPDQAGYPHWFVASAARTSAGMGKAARLGAAEVPANGTALLLFEQASAGTPWKLASSCVLASGVSLPPLAADSAGYIRTVKLSATTLLARPDVTGPLQAAVVDDGPASAATKAVADGPLTTGMYAGANSYVMGLRPPAGDVYTWHLEGSNLAKFAFRTAAGGALVFYAMYLNTFIAVPAYLDKGYPVNPGQAIKYPADLAPWLSGTPTPRISLEAQDLLSFAAIDPPAAPAKIQVIAIGGGLNYATAS